MPVQTWEAVVNSGAPYQTTDGAAYTASTSATDVSPAPQITLPANYYYVGQVFRLTAFGLMSAASAPTLVLGFYYGGVAGTALCATVATTTQNTANTLWRAEALCRVRTLGSSGVINSVGWCTGIASTPATLTQMPATGATGNAVTVNTTTANAWTLGATWGTNNASTLTCYAFVLEQLT
jgi:hypothetical protein